MFIKVSPTIYIILSFYLSSSSVEDMIQFKAAKKFKTDASGSQNCTNHLETIDRCSSLATYSYTTSINHYPFNASEMRASCDRITEGLKCLKTHGKCLSSVARRSLISYSNARSKHSRKLCANLNDPKALDFLKAAECIRNKNKTNVMVADEKELISTIQLLALQNSTLRWEERFHQACCSANTYKVNVLKNIKPECLKFESSTEEMLNSMIGELLESACPDQQRLNEICPKLKKLVLSNQWKGSSLTGAALDLIVALSDNPKD